MTDIAATPPPGSGPGATPVPVPASEPVATQAEKAIATPKAIAADTRKQRMRGNRSLAVLATVAVIMLLYFGAPFFIPLPAGTGIFPRGKRS